MERQPEIFELMNEEKQVAAYIAADFEEPHSKFINLLCNLLPDTQIKGYALDLGCGAADITRRFAERFPHCHVHGIDGSMMMLKYGEETLKKYGLMERVQLFEGYIPEVQLPRTHYEIIISNSLLHHLADPHGLWRTIKAAALPSTYIFIMDLMRPESLNQAKFFVNQYAANHPAILRRDFLASLRAAYRPEEIKTQLQINGLEHLQVKIVSDRHFIVQGINA